MNTTDAIKEALANWIAPTCPACDGPTFAKDGVRYCPACNMATEPVEDSDGK